MGDSRIVISIIFRSYEISETHEIVVSGDSTLLDVVNDIHSKILAKNIKQYDNTKISFDSSSSGAAAVKSDSDPSSSSKSESSPPLVISAYDTTYHPPKDITQSIVRYDQSTGTNSITVQSMGWFPSGRLVLFETGDGAARDGVLKSDVHYRLGDVDHVGGGSAVTNTVVETGPVVAESRPLPSQMLHTVTNRFDDDNGDGKTGATTNDISQTARRRRKEEKRNASLDLRIKALETENTSGDDGKGTSKRKGRKKKVSQQVQRILIKSRSEGDKKLRQEDRFFIETVLLLDDNGDDDHDDEDENSGEGAADGGKEGQRTSKPYSSSAYRFYSKFASVGKVATSVANTLDAVEGRSSELIVSTKISSDNGGGEEGGSIAYRRLPNTMRLYEAEALGHVTQFSRVIVRVYNMTDEMSATPSIT